MGAALIAAGLVNGALIGMVLLVRGISGRNRAAALLGSMLVLAAVAASLILANTPFDRHAAPLSSAAEVLLALIAGPLVVAGVRQLLGRPIPWLLLAFLLLAACLAIGSAASMGADPTLYAVPIQIAFTLWAWLIFAGARSAVHDDRRRRAHQRARAALALLLAVSGVHLAQITRLAVPENELLRPIVPLTLALLFIALTLAAALRLFSPQTLSPLSPEVAGEEDAFLLGRLRSWLEEERRYADPDLRIHDAAAALGRPVAELSAAANAAGHAGFPGYLQWFRIEQAKDQLADPAERRTSIDAIGLGCGFRSRSAFYQAYRRETGVTPGEYRKRMARKLS